MNFHEVDGGQVPKFQPIRTGGTRICPYNKSHIIRAEKWNLHLMKCRKNHPDSGIVECRFVFGHHIPKEKIEEHEKECYKEHWCNGNKTPLNDQTFIIPHPLRNVNGSVSSSDPEWEEEIQINHQIEPVDQDGKPLALENPEEKNEMGAMPKTDKHNVYDCDICKID